MGKLHYHIRVPEPRDGIDIDAHGTNVPFDQALAFAFALLRTVQEHGTISVRPIIESSLQDDPEPDERVAKALAVAGRAWEYGAPALYEDDVTDLFAALGHPIDDEDVASDARCDAKLYHGPGHQSGAPCEVKGPHDVHQAHYDGGQLAEWRDGQWREGEPHGITGFFDEPPTLRED